jgi:flagellin
MAVSPISDIASNYVGIRLARILNDNSVLLQKSLERLTSGLRIISAGDDPSGLANSVRPQNEIGRMGAVSDSIADITDYVQTQSDFLDDVSTSLTRMSELATLSAATATDAQRSAYQIEFSQLQVFVSDVGQKTFNNISLFNAGAMATIVDENGRTFTLSALTYNSVSTAGGLASVYNPSTLDVATTTAAATAQAAVSAAVINLSVIQGRIGGNIQMLGLYDDLLTTASENLTSIKDRLLNVDTASESAEFSRLDLLTQTGSTMIANWNTLRTNLLSLIQF